MKAKIIMILALLLLSVLFCASENSISPIPDNSRLSIETSREVYSWKAGGGDRYIVIEGTIENTTDTTFYSRLGDGFGSAEQNQMFFASNSAGFLEKYDNRSRTWIESDLLGILIEGSRIVPIKPEEEYSLHAFLRADGETETGKYRLRVDFYDHENYEEGEKPLRAYSNSFEIKLAS